MRGGGEGLLKSAKNLARARERNLPHPHPRRAKRNPGEEGVAPRKISSEPTGDGGEGGAAGISLSAEGAYPVS